MKITVLGSGRWGSFLAWYAATSGHDTLMWGRESSEITQKLFKERKNEYLTLPNSLRTTTDLREALNHSDFCIISISAQALRSFAAVLNEEKLAGKTFLLCMKGLEESSGKRLSVVMRESIDQDIRLAVLAGPGHAQSFVAGISGVMVVDSADAALTAEIAQNLSSDLLRLYKGHDLVGTEIGAAAKNVIGIGAGILDGFGYESLKGALMARGAREVARLMKALGADELSAYGLCHLGDYEATLFSPHSNNRRFGELFAQGKKQDKLSEGVATCAAMVKLGEELGVDLPISKALYNIVYLGNDPKEELTTLFLRSIKAEFE